jgi:hypothetical protein
VPPPLALLARTVTGGERFADSITRYLAQIPVASTTKVSDGPADPAPRNPKIGEIFNIASGNLEQGDIFDTEAKGLARVAAAIATASAGFATTDKFNAGRFEKEVKSVVSGLRSVITNNEAGQGNLFGQDEDTLARALIKTIHSGEIFSVLAAPASPAARLSALRSKAASGATLTAEENAQMDALDRYLGQQFLDAYEETKAEERRMAQLNERAWWDDSAKPLAKGQTAKPPITDGQIDLLFGAPKRIVTDPTQIDLGIDSGPSAPPTDNSTTSAKKPEEKALRTFPAFKINDDQFGLDLQSGARKRIGATRDIKIAREEIMPDAVKLPDMVPADIGQGLSGHQKLGVNLALNSLYGDDYDAFYNADGTGAGKTRQIIGIAESARRKGQKVIIVTQSDKIISDAFKRDSEVMGVDVYRWGGDRADLQKDADSGEPRIYIATYTAFSRGAIVPGQFDLVLLDEAHNLKNTMSSQRAEAGSAVVTQAGTKVGFFTATGLDKFQHLQYLIKLFPEYGSLDALAHAAGVVITTQKGGDAVQIKEGLVDGKTEDDVQEFIDELFGRLTARGQMVKREVPMDNLTFAIREIPLSDSAFREAENVYWTTRASVNSDLFKEAVAMQATRRFIEAFKIPAVLEDVKARLAEGKQVVIFADRIADTAGSLGTLDTLAREIESYLEQTRGKSPNGMPLVSRFYGPDKSQNSINLFQDGTSPVLLATPQSGGAGISLDDVVGDSPRHLIIMTPPFSAVDILQIIGRVNRLGTASPATATLFVSDMFADTWGVDIATRKLVLLGASVAGDIRGIDTSGDRTDALDAGSAARFMGRYFSARMLLDRKPDVRSLDEADQVANDFDPRANDFGDRQPLEVGARIVVAQRPSALNDPRAVMLDLASITPTTFTGEITPNVQEALWQVMGSSNQTQIVDAFRKLLTHADPKVSDGAWALYYTLRQREKSRNHSDAVAEIWARNEKGLLIKTPEGAAAFRAAMENELSLNPEAVFRAWQASRDAEAWATAQSGEKFRSLSPHHATLEEAFQNFINEKALTPAAVKFLRSIYANVENPSYLEDMAFSVFEDGTALGLGGPNYVGLRKGLVGVKAKKGEPKSNATREAKNIIQFSAKIFLHEMGHAAYFTFLTTEQRRQVNLEYARVGGKVGTKKWLRAGSPYQGALARLKSRNEEYYSKNVFEFFAETFAEWVIDGKTPPSALLNIMNDTQSDLRRWVLNLRRRGPIPDIVGAYSDAMAFSKNGATSTERTVDFGLSDVQLDPETLLNRRTALVRWMGGMPSDSGTVEQWLAGFNKAMQDIDSEGAIDIANWHERARIHAQNLRDGRGMQPGEFLRTFGMTREEARARSGVNGLRILDEKQFRSLWGVSKETYRRMTGLDDGDAAVPVQTTPPAAGPGQGSLFGAPGRTDVTLRDDTPDLFAAPRRVAPGVTSPQQTNPQLRERIAKTIGTLEDNRPLSTRLRDWWKTLKTEGERRIKQGALDSFYSILDLEQRVTGNKRIDAAISAHEAALRTKNITGLMDTVMRRGMLEYVGGATRIRAGTQGIGNIVRQVMIDGEDVAQAWEFYIAAYRAKRLKGEGREENFTDADIAAGLALAGNTLSNGKTFEQVRQEYSTWNGQLLDFAEQAGLINRSQRASWEHSDYVPFYRVLSDESLRGPQNKGGLTGQSAKIQLLTGAKGRVAPIENILLNAQHLIDASVKNIAARRVAELIRLDPSVGEELPAGNPPLTGAQLDQALRGAGLDPATVPAAVRNSLAQELADRNMPNRDNIIALKEGGKTVRFRIDDELLYRAITNFGADRHSLVMRLFGIPRKILTRTITLDPGFMVRNAIRDSVAAWVISEANTKPIVSSMKGFASAMREDPAMLAIIAGGGGTGGFYQMNPASMRKQLRALTRPQDRAELLRRLKTMSGWKDTILDTPRATIAFLDRLGQASEMANRIALYEATVKAGGSQAEGIARANDLLNFSMHGDWTIVKFMTNAVPFLNARIQGLYKLWRAADIETNPAKAIAQRRLMSAKVAMHGLQIALASVALYLLNRDDERYEELEEWDKDNYYHFFLDKLFTKEAVEAAGIDPKFWHVRMPKPFEVGMIFGTAPERMLGKMMGDYTGAEVAKRLRVNLMETLNFNPVPQLIRPAIDVFRSNKDSFTGRPIVNDSESRLAPEAQYDARTSAVARAAGEAFGASPKQLEYLVRGYFGTLGTYAMQASDMLVRDAMGFPEAPEKGLSRQPILGTFLRGNDPTNTKYLTEFYDAFQETEKLHATVKSYRERGDFAKAAEVRARANPAQVALVSRLRKVREQLSDLRKQEQRILEASFTPAEKKNRIDAITARKAQLTESVMRQYRTLANRTP